MKGVSPLVATVLLVSITMALSVVVAFWSNQYVKERTTEFEEFSQQEKQCGLGNMRFLEDLKYSGGTGGTLSALVENNGRVSLSNFNFQIVYKDSTQGNVSISSDSVTPGNFLIISKSIPAGKEPRFVKITTSCQDVFLEKSFT